MGHEVESIDQTPATKRRGCLFYGCLGLVVLALVGGIAAYWAVNKVMTFVNDYTDDLPSELPVVEFAEAEAQALRDRVEQFGDVLEAGGDPPSPLELSADDINALVDSDPDWAQIGQVHVSIGPDDQLRGEVSIPLDDFGFEGRYFNGSVTLDVSLENGILIVRPSAAEVKGQPLPDEFIEALRTENMAKRAYEDPKIAAILQKLERIEVRDGKLVITPDAKTGQ